MVEQYNRRNIALMGGGAGGGTLLSSLLAGGKGGVNGSSAGATSGANRSLCHRQERSGFRGRAQTWLSADPAAEHLVNLRIENLEQDAAWFFAPRLSQLLASAPLDCDFELPE